MEDATFVILQTGFSIWGVHFNRHVEMLEGVDQYDFPVVHNVNLITNYAALKHLVPSGRKYFNDNDNNEIKAA